MRKMQSKSKPLAKGFSLTEVLVTVGIIGALSAIATVSYLDYMERGHLSHLEQSIQGFLKAVDVCLMLKGDDLDRCNTHDKLKFSCKNCSEVSMPDKATYSWAKQNRLMVEMNSGEFSACTRYTPYNPKRELRLKVTISHTSGKKFCQYNLRTNAERMDLSTGTFLDTAVHGSINIVSVRLPFEPCEARTDCKDSTDKCIAPTTTARASKLGCIGHDVINSP